MTEYFIDEQFLKNKTQVGHNVDAGDLSPYFEMAAETYLPPVLGFNFYRDLLEKYNNNNLSADETELVGFIKNVVAQWTAYLAASGLTYRISNKGLQSQSGEFSSSEGMAVLDETLNRISSQAHLRESNLRSYLNLNKDKFPDWTDDSNEDITAPDFNKSSGGRIQSI